MSTPNYQLIKKLEKLDFFKDLLSSGIIPVNWIDYKVIYEFYMNEVNILTLNKVMSSQELRSAKRTAKTITAEQFSIGESSVYQIIKKMS